MAQRRALPQSQTRPAQPQAKEGALLLPSSSSPSSPSSLLRLISPFPSHHTCSSHLTPSHIFSPFKNRTVYPVSFFFFLLLSLPVSSHFPFLSSSRFFSSIHLVFSFFASLLVSYLISLLISLLIPRYFFIFFVSSFSHSFLLFIVFHFSPPSCPLLSIFSVIPFL